MGLVSIFEQERRMRAILARLLEIIAWMMLLTRAAMLILGSSKLPKLFRFARATGMVRRL